MSKTYTVEVTAIGGWTRHSEHESYRAAVDQADMVHGRVMVGEDMSDESAWRWAVANQGFNGDFGAWQSQDDEERDEHER